MPRLPWSGRTRRESRATILLKRKRASGLCRRYGDTVHHPLPMIHSLWGMPVKAVIAGLVRLFVLPLACVTCGAGTAFADFKDFRDWHAVCDNLRSCVAYGFEGDDRSTAYMSIQRDAGPAAPARITIAVDVDEPTKAALSFDDPALPGLPADPVMFSEGDGMPFGLAVIDDPKTVDTLVASMRKAQTLVIRRLAKKNGAKNDVKNGGVKNGAASEAATSRISLSGAVAALLWIDEQQQRLDTVTALIRRGSKPESAVPPLPKAPAVRVAKRPPVIAPRPLPPAEMHALTAKARSLCSDDERTALDQKYRLATDLALYGFSCPGISGAYNAAAVFLIAPDGRLQAARPVTFAYPPGIDGAAVAGDAVVMNAAFDQATMTLTTFNKGRGIADCGAEDEWVFDGQTFHLLSLRKMPYCKGITSDEWPLLYQAERK
jgi:hypothetical protein